MEDLNNYAEIFKGNVGSFDVFTNSLEVQIRDKRILFEFDLNYIAKHKDGQSHLKEKFSVFFSDKTEVSLLFENCIFEKQLFSHRNVEHNNSFFNCKFESPIKIPEIRIFGKIRFRDCDLQQLDFQNTVFEDLLDFWNCIFYKKLIFHKTDFLGTVTFSGSKFTENVLFTYSLIQKNLIFRGTRFVKGLDLATASIPGVLQIFNMYLGDYQSKFINASDLDDFEVEYNDSISEVGEIPIKNKRETYRILKYTLVSEHNIYESLEYKKLEKETLREELRTEKRISKNYPDRFNLWMNFISNNHGKSYLRAVVFTLICGWILFSLSILNTDQYFFTLNPLLWEFSHGLKYFIMFLLPTHSFDYLGDEVVLYTAFYVFDFFGRIVVGYGIYQFIQAFRKFR